MGHNSGWVVHKFGGTSVANAERYRHVAKLIQAEPSKLKAVVVSAMSGVTDALIQLTDLAQNQNSDYLVQLEILKSKHLDTLKDLFPSKISSAPSDLPASRLISLIESDFHDLGEILRGIYLTRNCPDRTTELVAGYGELWSAQLLEAYLGHCHLKTAYVDARNIIMIDHHETGVSIHWADSEARIKEHLQNLKDPLTSILVIPGFIASMPDGIPTTLGRNGSDLSASIFGSLLKASRITIWTDVNGVLTADPRLVPEAVVLEEMSYHEATELAYFGAKVLHPSTMAPAIAQQIPIWIRNTYSDHPGTKIHATPRPSSQVVKGFASIDKMALVNIEGTGMLGVPGIAQKLFGSLREVNVSVVMISQASSEHSICFAIPQNQAQLTKQTVEKLFQTELQHGQIQTIHVTEDCSILAAVGDGMVQRPGIAGRFLGALGKASINIRAIAQGSSERNISTVIDRKDTTRALRAVHSSFYLSDQTISIGLIGPGLIGGTFLKQLDQQLSRLKNQFKIDLRIRGIANSQKMILSEGPIPLSSWKDLLEQSTTKTCLKSFADHVLTDYLPHSVMIDCTASQEIPEHYMEWLEKGIHLIAANKRANTGTMEFYRALRKTSQARNRHFLYQTNVGAGLPIINTLRDLVQTGDQIESIEGIFSGTLSFLFNHFQEGKSFSSLIQEAQAKGYTEPDPKDDLSGKDVARKLAILAREMGLEVELEQISIQSLASYSDSEMSAFLTSARKRNETLRYVGAIHTKTKKGIQSGAELSVQLQSYPSDHPFSLCTGCNNMVAFRTARYHTHPLVIQGPGAGPEVTAAGVFADLLRLSSLVGGGSQK